MRRHFVAVAAMVVLGFAAQRVNAETSPVVLSLLGDCHYAIDGRDHACKGVTLMYLTNGRAMFSIPTAIGVTDVTTQSQKSYSEGLLAFSGFLPRLTVRFGLAVDRVYFGTQSLPAVPARGECDFDAVGRHVTSLVCHVVTSYHETVLRFTGDWRQEHG